MRATDGKRDQEGAALLTLLWIIPLLVALALVAWGQVALGVSLTRRWSRENWAFNYAREGVRQAIILLEADPTRYDFPGDPWANGGKPHRGTFGGGTMEFAISDEGSRLNLNAVTPEVLNNLPGLDIDKTDALMDWRDADEAPRPGGAEAEYYRKEGRPVLPRNGLLASMAEVRLIRGWEGFQEMGLVTVYGPLNLNTASLDALYALFLQQGVDSFRASAIITDLLLWRQAGMRTDPPLSEGEFGAPFNTMEDAAMSIPGLRGILEEIQPWVTVEGTVNVNTAPEPVLRAVLVAARLTPAQVEQIVDLRKRYPFPEMRNLEGAVGTEVYRRVRYSLSTTSTVFRIEAWGEYQGMTRRITVIVERQRHNDAWETRVLRWEEY